MKSSVYISSEKIEVIRYTGSGARISVKDYTSHPLPEGVMINGKIIDPASVTESLDTLRKQKPALFASPTLIVDGNSIFSKKIVMPKLNKWQKLQLIRNEFADTTQDIDELVCDWQPLGKAGGTAPSMLACAAERQQVETYISAFQNAGVKLEAIRIGAQAIQSYVDARPELHKTTFVLNVIDGLTLFSMIFDNGINIFTSRTRLYSEDKEHFIQSLIENLSGLIQFNRSEKFQDIAASYYLGLGGDDLNALSEASPYPDITLAPLDIFGKAVQLPADAHFAYLNALLGKDSIDLMRGRTMLEQLKKRQRPKPWLIPALICVAAVLAIPVVFLLTRINALDKDIAEINAYLENPAVTAKSEELGGIQTETARYQYVIDQLNGKTAAENGKPQISNQILDLVTGTHSDKVKILKFSFDESTGALSVDGSSATELDSARYVDALKAGGLVKDVRYTGYSYSNSNNEVVYNFSIDLILFAAEVVE